MSNDTYRTDSFSPPDPQQSRSQREWLALARITERHGATDDQRQRHAHPTALEPHEAVKIVMLLAANPAELEADEPSIDDFDITAALTLIAHLRADIDTLELGLLESARGRGMTWQTIAHGAGLGSAQAAKQRRDRLNERRSSAHEIG